MPLARSAWAWFATPKKGNSSSQDDPHPGASSEKTRVDTEASAHQTKRRVVATQPMPLAVFVANSGDENCCKQINCARMFASQESPFYDAEMLKAEQDTVAALRTREDRKVFATERVPIIKREAGSMLAAGKAVCTKFFCASFGMSKNLVASVKGNPAARASSSIARSVPVCLPVGHGRL